LTWFVGARSLDAGFMGDRKSLATTLTFLDGDGEMAALVRGRDWSKTALGPVDDWTESLRGAVSMCLGSRFPFALYWGDEFTLVYNDAWRPIAGEKHPACLGAPARDVWSEVWPTLRPMLEGVRDTGKGVFYEDMPFALQRFGYLEETHFSLNMSPSRGRDGAVEGLVNIVIETTYRVLDERRTRVLDELGARVAGAPLVDIGALATASLAGQPADVPFALLYLVDAEAGRARLAGACGIADDHPDRLAEVGLADGDDGDWPIARVVSSRRAAIVDLRARHGQPIVGAAWPEAVREALVVPVSREGRDEVVAVVVLGVSPRRALDAPYRGFLELCASRIGAAIGAARAHDDARRPSPRSPAPRRTSSAT
jgi:hypothetical protein